MNKIDKIEMHLVMLSEIIMVIVGVLDVLCRVVFDFELIPMGYYVVAVLIYAFELIKYSRILIILHKEEG